MYMTENTVHAFNFSPQHNTLYFKLPPHFQIQAISSRRKHFVTT